MQFVECSFQERVLLLVVWLIDLKSSIILLGSFDFLIIHGEALLESTCFLVNGIKMDKFGFLSDYLNGDCSSDGDSIFITQKSPKYQPVNLEEDTYNFPGLIDEHGKTHVLQNVENVQSVCENDDSVSQSPGDVTGLELVKYQPQVEDISSSDEM